GPRAPRFHLGDWRRGGTFSGTRREGRRQPPTGGGGCPRRKATGSGGGAPVQGGALCRLRLPHQRAIVFGTLRQGRQRLRGTRKGEPSRGLSGTAPAGTRVSSPRQLPTDHDHDG